MCIAPTLDPFDSHLGSFVFLFEIKSLLFLLLKLLLLEFCREKYLKEDTYGKLLFLSLPLRHWLYNLKICFKNT